MIPPKYWSPTKKLMVLGAMAGGKLVEDTATGNPLTFFTDVSKPLKSLLIPFTPQQEGTGDPSPQNIRSILPWNGLTVWQGGANVFDGVLENGYINDQGQNEGTGNIRSKNYIPVFPSATYFVYFVPTSETAYNMKVFYYDKDKAFISSFWKRGGNTTVAPSNAYYMRFYMDGAYTSGTDREIGINYPSTETAYEPYHPITETDIVFPSPVYGGTLDVVSGVMTVEWIFTSAKWSDFSFGAVLGDNTRKVRSLPQKGIGGSQSTGQGHSILNVTNVYTQSNAQDTVHYYISTNGSSLYLVLPNDFDENEVIQCAYELAEPFEIALTPEQITAILGSNTIWSDADGQMTAVYLKKG